MDDSSIPQRRVGDRYELRSEIGRGAMGVVWLARDLLLQRDVALKRLGMLSGADFSGSGSAALARTAEREAQTAARLDHPHVVGVFDLINDGDHYWLVMEFVPGSDLAAVVAHRGPLDPETAQQVFAQVASALAAAHGAGIVHRDIKPSNLLLTGVDSGAPWGVKLTDFGIARLQAENATTTMTGAITGSPAYIAPEVAQGEPASPASDVWSLGATLFHALEGAAPFSGRDNAMATLFAVVNEPVPKARAAGSLSKLVSDMLSKDPAERPSAAAVEARLARAVPAPERTRRLRIPGGAAAMPDEGDATGVAEPARPFGAEGRQFGHRSGQYERTAVVRPVVDPRPIPQSANGEGLGPHDAATRPRTRTWAVWALGVASVLVLVLGMGVVFGALNGPEDNTAGPPNGGSQSGDSSSEPAIEETTLSADELESFPTDYLSTVTEDPKEAWKSLSKDFQKASGGLKAYEGFWETIDSATVSAVSSDAAAQTVNYTVNYLKTDGSSFSDEVTLRLERSKDDVVIAEER